MVLKFELKQNLMSHEFQPKALYQIKKIIIHERIELKSRIWRKNRSVIPWKSYQFQRNKKEAQEQ